MFNIILIYKILSTMTSNSAPNEVEHTHRLIVAEHACCWPGQLRPEDLTLKFFP
jgi:hypothetical protein